MNAFEQTIHCKDYPAVRNIRRMHKKGQPMNIMGVGKFNIERILFIGYSLEDKCYYVKVLQSQVNPKERTQ
jgi:hypothetical protein